MIEQTDLAGSFTLPGTSMTLNRMGYGAMQLAGPERLGTATDVDAAIAVLREAVESGVNHIDTSDYYGPHVTNQIIKQALHPYPDGLVIVTKVGARRGRRQVLDSRSFPPGADRRRSRQPEKSRPRSSRRRQSSGRRNDRSRRRDRSRNR